MHVRTSVPVLTGPLGPLLVATARGSADTTEQHARHMEGQKSHDAFDIAGFAGALQPTLRTREASRGTGAGHEGRDMTEVRS
jgi:hypothetical protein